MRQTSTVLIEGKDYSLENLANSIERAVEDGCRAVTLLLTSGDLFSEQQLSDHLKTIPVPVSGGIFPEVIFGERYFSQAAVMILWNQPLPTRLFRDISNRNSSLYQFSNQNEVQPEDLKHKLVFLSSTSSVQEKALEALYYRNSSDIDYTGSVAGLADESRPSIISNEGLLSDVMQVISVPHRQHTTVAKGWKVISGPHLVTASEENCVSEFDYVPVQQRCQELLESSAFDHLRDRIKDQSFEQILDRFPGGIKNIDEDMLVRDVLSYDERGLHFRGEVPTYSNMYILSGETDELLEDVADNLYEFTGKQEESADIALMFCCKGRRRKMAEHSDQELKLLASGFKHNQSLVGTVSRGEVASNSTGYVRLLSQSLVVSRFVA